VVRPAVGDRMSKEYQGNTEMDDRGPGGERTWDSDAMGPLYDTPQHTEDYLEYPVYMRPIGGGWC